MVILAVTVLCMTAMPAFPAYAQETQKIRVGYFEFEGYHMIDAQGNRSGYGYDYLQYVARCANFKYEYVGFDKSWNDMQDMLENGEIDLLTSAQKTEDRLGRFDFSDQPIGESTSILTIKAGNNRYMTDDYALLDGIRIGLLTGNSRNTSLESFASEKGFTYQPVYYEDTASLTDALQKGQDIDAALTSNLRKIENEWIVARFDAHPFYIMVQKGNTQLLEEINDAIEKIKADNPDLQTTLYEKYYSVQNGNEIAYTAEERNYIENLQNADNPVQVAINSQREPISYFKGTEARGILPEIARKVFARSGIPCEIVPMDPSVDSSKFRTEGAASVYFDSSFSFSDAEKYGLRVTEPFLKLTLSYITLAKFTAEPKSVAMLQNSNQIETYIKNNYDAADITKYKSLDECIKAVLDGRQDAIYLQTYAAQNVVNKDVRNRLKEQLVPGYDLNLSIAVREDDPLLFSILNKAIRSMSQEEMDQIILKQTLKLAENDSLAAYLYDHPILWLVLLAIAACFIMILSLYFFRRKNLRLEKEKNQEFERFIAYVCKANDRVIEIDVEKQISKFYQLENGRVCSRTEKLNTGDMQIERLFAEDRPAVEESLKEENIRHLIASGGEKYFECRIMDREHSKRYQWFAFTIQGVPTDNQDTGKLMVFSKNIDHVKKEEEEKKQALEDALVSAQQAGEAKGAFMSRMSHEIRTPLNAIIGYLTIAKSNLQHPAKEQECLEKSEFAAHHLLNIINDVLDISAIESGRMKIAHEVFDIRQLLSGITSIFHNQAKEKKVEFYVGLHGLTEEHLVGDQLRLNQILMNLLSNAVKFTPAGGNVIFKITQKNLAGKKVYLQIEVRDTGIGMSEEYKKRLFRPFEQQDALTAQKFGGTGLGLSITKNLVTMMAGTIDVESEEGKGTAFTVNLSFETAESAANAVGTIYDFSNMNVLALCDENSDYTYIDVLLRRFGVTYNVVLDQEKALYEVREKKASGREYDLYLLDWDIPDMDGIKMAERIREAGSKEKPVIVAAAYDIPNIVLEDTQIQRVVLKPIFQSSMFDVLSNICKISRPNKNKDMGDVKCRLDGIRVLLAEDNEMNMEIAKEILSSYGLIIDGAVNGREAAELFEQSKEGDYQAILMDIQMPVMNGYDAARRIRHSGHPQAGTIPIIAMTADAFVEDVNRALAAGMNDHVSKPVDFGKLCRILSQYIGGMEKD